MNLEANNYESYILNDQNMITYLKYKLNNSNNNNNKENLIKKDDKHENTNSYKKNSLFIPKENDSLFWCYYIILNGDCNYEILNVKNSLIEKQLKINYINKIRENKNIIKTYKFDTITNIESNLANDNYISIKTVISLCAIEKINLIFVRKKTYFELLMNDNEPIYVIRELENQSKYSKKYGFEVINKNILDEIRETLYKVDVLSKPIKALSSYKVQDLINIADKLAIEILNKETGKNKTKNEIYESIIQYF